MSEDQSNEVRPDLSQNGPASSAMHGTSSTEELIAAVLAAIDNARANPLISPPPTPASEWALGRPPDTPQEFQLELEWRRLREQEEAAYQSRRYIFDSGRDEAERRATRNLEADKLRAEIIREQMQGTRYADNVRSYVLMLVILAVVSMPLVGIFTSVAPEDFSQFIAPITGIAGTVIGYWFGQRGSNQAVSESLPPISVVDNAPQEPPGWAATAAVATLQPAKSSTGEPASAQPASPQPSRGQ